MRVYIITCCLDARQLYGSTLVFETLRTGFPTAEVLVVDNASVNEARSAIFKKAAATGALLQQVESRAPHHFLLERILASHTTGPAVVVDPDIVFWENVEGWRFDGALMAGRLIPRHLCGIYKCLTHPRLHTSFWWIPDAPALALAFAWMAGRLPNFSPLRGFSFFHDGDWQWYDTAANLYAALGQRTRAFTEKELDAYDHLFCGSHLEAIRRQAPGPLVDLLRQAHDTARADWRGLKGIWRLQEEYFQSRAALLARAPSPAESMFFSVTA